jgi:hypothetical protein
MIWALLLAAVVTVQSQAPAAQPPQDERQPPPEVQKVPKDSVEIATAGCLKGRVFTAVGRPEEESTRKGPNVTGLSFRVAGKKDVMKQVKEHDGHFVEINGLVLKSALAGPGPGARIGNTKVTIGAGRDPLSGSSRSAPQGGVPVMDISSLRYLSPSCPIERR